MSDLPTNPADTTGAMPLPKPALAPGVRSRVMLPNAAQPTGPGLASGRAGINPGPMPSLGAPKPRLRAIEPLASAAAASYKVSVPDTTHVGETILVPHVIASGLAAALAVTAAVLIFLKY